MRELRDRDTSHGRAASALEAASPVTAGLLHDLGHHLMAVSLLAEALQADSGLSEEGRRRSELMVAETERALSMIAEARADAPPRPPDRRAEQLIDVRALAARVCDMAMGSHQAAIRLEPGSPVYLQVNPTVVWRVLWNLIDNAARAAGPRGHVWVAVRRSSGTRLIVSDDGPGPGNGPAGSAGLGLSVVRQLLAGSGGHLEIGERLAGGTSASAIFGSQSDRILIPKGAGGQRVD